MTDTTHQETAALVRQALHAVPEGAMFFVCGITTPAGGASVERARDEVNEVARELRAGLKDRRVTNMTIFVLYDGEKGGSLEKAQLLMPLEGGE